jgi:putative toxin-antitoxin system antitoxin component (TIGR02293 family)
MPATLSAPAAVGLNTTDPGNVHARILSGLPFGALTKFVRVTGLVDAARLIDLPERTLARRRDAKLLQPDESDRLYRLATVFVEAAELFGGDLAAAREWLSNPVRGLGDRVPLELTRTAVGTQLVLELIGRLEHGVFA